MSNYATSDAPWLRITAGATGTGNGSVAFTVDANAGAATRTGTLQIAGYAFTVTQTGLPCTFALTPTGRSFGDGGGSGGNVTVATPLGCAWTATTTVAWITISAGSANGPGQFSYTVAANPAGTARQATIGVGNSASQTTFAVTQDGLGAATLLGLTPQLVTAGGPAFTLTVNGTNFNPGATVRWNGRTMATEFISRTRLTATVPAADSAAPGTALITVFNPPGGAVASALSLIVARPLVNASAASFRPTGLAAEAIAAAFGTNLATATRVTVIDSAGFERAAPLLFAAPLQVNYVVPAGTALGPALVVITNNDGTVSAGPAQIGAVAPGLFAANGDGQGVATAVALRIRADGSRQFESVAVFEPLQNRFVAVPLDLGPSADQVFLVLFGTGLRGRNPLAAATVDFSGVTVPVSFIGPQGGQLGLDQVNVLVPRTLSGRGEVEIGLSVDGQTTNPVRLIIR